MIKFKEKIGCYSWTCVFSKDEIEKIKDGVWGITDFETCTVYFDDTIDNQMIFSTIVHELTHIIIDSQGRNLKPGNNVFNEEEVCEFVAHCSPDILTQALDIYNRYMKKAAKKK